MWIDDDAIQENDVHYDIDKEKDEIFLRYEIVAIKLVSIEPTWLIGFAITIKIIIIKNTKSFQKFQKRYDDEWTIV